jgi:hypothetical protein
MDNILLNVPFLLILLIVLLLKLIFKQYSQILDQILLICIENVLNKLDLKNINVWILQEFLLL